MARTTAVPPTQGPALAPAGTPSDALRSLHRHAAERYAAVDSYIVRLHRQEQINGRGKPEEWLLVKFRKQPWSIYFKWLGNEGKGREVIYVPGQYEDKIHTLLAAGDMPLMPAGKRFAVAPDNPLVRSSSRHSIRDAGVGNLVEKFGRLLDAQDRGDGRAGSVRYLGPIQRPEFPAPCEAAEQSIPPGSDPALPRGGRRLWVFDPESKLPALIVTQDETGHQVEYYCYDRFQLNVHLDQDDFNPDKLWRPRGPGGPASSAQPR